jgi:signal transduction histidine kinase
MTPDERDQLARLLEAAREEERQRLARELHDELGQTLTAMRLELARIIALLRREQIAPAGIDRLQSLVGLAEIGMATVKHITMNRAPAALDHLGLAAAIEWEVATFRARTGLECHVTFGAPRTRLNHAQESAVFRILQEALTNIVRHAGASAVQVQLGVRGHRFEMRVKDNGRGITAAQSRGPGAVGVLGMRERTNLIGGTFAIEGRPGKGTVVTVQVPLRGGAVSNRSRSRTKPAPQRVDNPDRLRDAKGHRHRGEHGAIRREHEPARQDRMKRGRKA